jgi:hypothetical protein
VNATELKARFKNATDDFLRLNASAEAGATAVLDHHTGTPAKLERDTGDGALESLPVQKATGRRFFIRVTAFRERLLDEDNLCEKYHVDLCRYAGVLPGDGSSQTKIEVCQQKTEPGAAEEVLIEIFQTD